MKTLLSLLVLLAGCAAAPKPVVHSDPKPESAPTDGDSTRAGAVPIEANQVHKDELNVSQRDITDWKLIELRGKPGVLTVELSWDNPEADLAIDAFDGQDHLLGGSAARMPGEPLKRLELKLHPGTYYLRVVAPTANDSSSYQMQAKWLGTVDFSPDSVEAPKPKKHP